MPRKESILVFGGAGGVGSAVAALADVRGYVPFVADWSISGPGEVDISNGAAVVKFFREQGPFDHVVVASGLNSETKIGGLGFQREARLMMEVNYIGPMVALQAWLKSSYQSELDGARGHFVAVSSNSAHIPRSQSAGYCASKAALSMAIRCAARAEARRNVCIWGVEPGWIEGTAMSDRVRQRIAGSKVEAHRIPGGRTQTADEVAHFIMQGVADNSASFNGCMFRLDGGEI